MRRLSSDASSLTADSGAASSSGAADALGSFTDSDDDAISAALSQRLRSMDGSVGSDEDAGDIDPNAPLTAEELMLLVERKYTKRYDLTIARRTFAGKDFVSLNIMWVHLGQRSFPMSPAEYLDKLDGICVLLNAWNRQEQVRSFLRQKPKARNGMPPRPIVGTAVALQLDLPKETVEEWIGNRLG